MLSVVVAMSSGRVGSSISIGLTERSTGPVSDGVGAGTESSMAGIVGGRSGSSTGRQVWSKRRQVWSSGGLYFRLK